MEPLARNSTPVMPQRWYGSKNNGFLSINGFMIQGLVSVLILNITQLYPTIGDRISIKYMKVLFKIPKQGTLTNSCDY